MTTGQEFMVTEHRHTKSRERRRLEGLWWAVVLIWAGLVFWADSMGLLPQIGEAGAWSWIFLGAGILALLGALYRVLSSNIPNPTTWDWVWGSFCLIIGLGGFTTINISWPLILILTGGVILVSVLLRRY
jgi:drug/metabolite transporter (DMT)-like permease